MGGGYRLVAIATGEQEYFDPSGISTAQEGAKSNALMRCCKDLGIASELWYVCSGAFLALYDTRDTKRTNQCLKGPELYTKVQE